MRGYATFMGAGFAFRFGFFTAGLAAFFGGEGVRGDERSNADEAT